MTPWLQLVCHPGGAKLRWAAIVGGSVPSYSKVRWWSRWDIMQQIALNFGALPASAQSKSRASLESESV